MQIKSWLFILPIANLWKYLQHHHHITITTPTKQTLVPCLSLVCHVQCVYRSRKKLFIICNYAQQNSKKRFIIPYLQSANLIISLSHLIRSGHLVNSNGLGILFPSTRLRFTSSDLFICPTQRRRLQLLSQFNLHFTCTVQQHLLSKLTQLSLPATTRSSFTNCQTSQQPTMQGMFQDGWQRHVLEIHIN